MEIARRDAPARRAAYSGEDGTRRAVQALECTFRREGNGAAGYFRGVGARRDKTRRRERHRGAAAAMTAIVLMSRRFRASAMMLHCRRGGATVGRDPFTACGHGTIALQRQQQGYQDRKSYT